MVAGNSWQLQGEGEGHAYSSTHRPVNYMVLYLSLFTGRLLLAQKPPDNQSILPYILAISSP